MCRDASSALYTGGTVSGSAVALTVAVAVPVALSMAVTCQHGVMPAGWSGLAPSTGPIGRAPSTGPIGRAAILQHGVTPYLSVTWFAAKSAHTGCPMCRDASSVL